MNNSFDVDETEQLLGDNFEVLVQTYDVLSGKGKESFRHGTFVQVFFLPTLIQPVPLSNTLTNYHCQMKSGKPKLS
jgi:hypothetical protein